MRSLRALFLTLIVAVLTLGLLCLQAAAVLRLTLLNPTFIVGALDRAGFYNIAVDAALAAIAPPPGSPEYESAMVIIEAARKTLEPEPVRTILSAALPQAMQLLTDPDAPRSIKVDLRPLRDTFIASLRQAGQAQHATPRELREMESELKRTIPDTVDLVNQLGLDAADLDDLSRFYTLASRILLAFVGSLALLAALAALLARRTWRAWLAAPLLISGLAVLAAALIVVARAPQWLAKAVDLPRVLPPSMDPGAITGVVLGIGSAFLLVAGAVGLVVAAAGCLLARLGRRSGRSSALQA